MYNRFLSRAPSSLVVFLLACGGPLNNGGKGGSDTATVVDGDSALDSRVEGDTATLAACAACPAEYQFSAGDCDGDWLTTAREGELGSDDCDPDSDNNGVTDWDEVMACADPVTDDGDGDGLSDADEITVYHSSPCSDDTDGDGWGDEKEAACGSDPNEGDPDLDRLSDEVECEAGLNPREPDSDYDGYRDTLEWEWDPTGGMALDPSLPDLSAPVGVELECDNGAAGYDYYNAIHFPDSGGDGYYDYYFYTRDGSSVSTSGEGSECICTVVVTDARVVEVSGIKVWLDVEAHKGTDWEVEPVPAAVAVQPPTSISSSLQTSFHYNDFDSINKQWFAFDADSAIVDDNAEFDLASGAKISAAGVYTIYVSRVTDKGKDIGFCDRIGPHDWPTGTHTALKLRVDSLNPPTPPPAPPLLCRPGATSRSEVDLLDLGFGPRPLVRAGAPSLAGAKARQIDVRDWRGARSLTLVGPNGFRQRLDPAHPSAILPGEGAPLSNLGWQVERDPGDSRSPALSILHSCAGGGANSAPPAAAGLSFLSAQDALRRILPGVTLEALGIAVADPQATMVTLRFAPNGNGQTELVAELPGLGRLAAWPTTPGPAQSHRVEANGPGYALSLVIFEHNWGLDIRIPKGTIGTPMGPVSVGGTYFELRRPQAVASAGIN